MMLLQVDDLAKSFGGVQAVRNVSFTLEAGQRLAIIGPNGAGKSTCFNMVGGQLSPGHGRIVLAGDDITGLPPHLVWAKGVGRTFQVAAAFSSMSVRENVQMALLRQASRLRAFWSPARREAVDRADALLERVGMAAQAERPAAVLAYGDIKRLELAIALAHDPKLLLMDEPTAGMSAPERQALMELVTSIVGEARAGLLFTEHDMGVVFNHADRILVLAGGEVVAEGAPDTIKDDPTVQAIYLGHGFDEATA